MRRSLALLALIAVPLAACASGTKTEAALTTSISVTISSGDAMTDALTDAMTDAMTAAMTTGPSPAADVAPAPESMMEPPTSDAVTEESPPAAVATGITITTASSDYGEVLFDGSGQAIYLFDKETSAVPDCYGDCASAWPPVLTDGPPVADAGTMTDLLGTTPRTDGSIQVTYAGHPLYYYAHEGKNEVTCHDVNEFGGLWLVVTPTGQAAA